ncbi:uncharacterized protein IUM83_08415 [Phytophthora cinnamomi]|uniref:uncharacterized protein n=1 Tax=Phytophthora cinnamomi TaxID=4785 RepID=UPI00355A60E4|nr:hypothetical protein IUM83_08415 [Phytophthora cinnamomi]
MPLFDAIESDVTAFFVSQGTVFDTLVKSFMDRVALVESSVAVLRSDVSNNFNLVNQRIDASNVAAAEVSAATAAAAAAAAASAALASLPHSFVSDVDCPSHSSPPPVATVVAGDGGGRNEELEYYVMTLSRQLNMVLEVLFQPHGNNIVEVVQAKQTRLHSISDVLTENEAILMELAMQHDDPKAFHGEPLPLPDVVSVHPGEIAEPVTKPQESNVDETQQTPAKNLGTADKARMTFTSSDRMPQGQTQMPSISAQDQAATTPSDHQVQVPQSPFRPESNTPEQFARSNAQAPVMDEHVSTPAAKSHSNNHHKQVVEIISPQLEASPLTKKEEIVRTVNNETDNQTSATTPDEHEDDGDEETDHMPIESTFQSQPAHTDISLHRTKSFFRNCQDLQRQEEERLREQRRREEELMRRMHELLLQSRAHLQQEHIEVWRQEHNDATQHQQQLIFHLQEQLQNQNETQLHLEQEWRREHGQQREADKIAIQHEIDRKLDAFSGIMAAAQATQGHELAQALQVINDFERRFVSPDALEAAGALWLKTAADNCIYGANPETLSSLLEDLQGFQNQLKQQTVKSPTITSLHEAVDRAIQLLQRPASPANDTASEQESTMYSLRQLLAKVDSSYRAAVAEHEELQFPGIGFLAKVIHRMELGTANLLDAVDFQQEHFQQTQAQQQVGLEKLQKELWRQQEIEKALRTQLGACPSKEDTLRLVQELRDQVTATAADSAVRMLDTVDDLRYRMAGLPSSQMLEQLATDLHARTDRITQDLDTTAEKFTHDLRQKVDRAEIDRLHSLFESGNGVNALPASLTKSPLRCLSCDQHLPFAQAPHDEDANPEPASNPGSPTGQRSGSPPRSPPSSPPRPIVYHNQHQDHLPYQQYPGYSPSAGVYNDLGINMGILEELFAASTSALERRRRQRQQLQFQLLTPHSEYDREWSYRKPAFLNIDDGRNKIPLRKTQLSDQVIYGPAITPNAFRKKRYDERPKTAMLPERRPGGEIITRTASTTVIVRPFSELADKRQQKR